MRRGQASALFVVLMVFAVSPGAALAAKAADVKQACSNTPGCGYSKHKNGSISGCIVPCDKKEGCCFYCADEQSECISVRKKGSTTAVPGEFMETLKPSAKPAPRPLNPRVNDLAPSPAGGVEPGVAP